jgi:hypothetical protein
VRYGSEANFLTIHPNSSPDPYDQRVKIEAVATSGGRRFSAVNDRIVAFSSEETNLRFADFADLKISEFELRISEGGWLRFKRDLRGYVTVRYRVCGDILAGMESFLAAMEGEVIVEGEYTNQLYRDILALLKGKA